MSRPSVTRVLVVTRRDPQEPIARSLRQAGYAVLRAHDSVAASRYLQRGAADIMVINEHACARNEIDSLSGLATQRGIPVHLLSYPASAVAGGAGVPLGQIVEAVLAACKEVRSITAGKEGETLTIGSLVVDLDGHTARIAETPLNLTAKEFELLCQFARRPGMVWSRSELIDLIWGYGYVDSHLVTVHIGNLRKKLGAASVDKPVRIEAIRGVGYRLTCPAAVETGRSVDQPSERPPVRGRANQSGRLPFVGRARELEVLRLAVDAAMAGVTQEAAIVGDPGIGKTRLAEEAAAYARDRGLRVYWGRCRDATAKPAYEPWVEILLQWQREDPSSDFAQVFNAEPRGAAMSHLEGESMRLALFDRLTDALRSKAEKGAIGLVLDDLHWAHSSTLLALQYVIGHLRDAAAVLLLTYRPGEVAQAHLLTEVMNDLVRGDLGTVIQLDPLSQSEVGRFVALSGLHRDSRGPAERAGLEASGELTGSLELVAEVYRETEGNPFLMTQLVRLRFLQGEPAETAPIGRALGREEGVRRVVLSRLSRLSVPCREALDVASIIGRDFTGPVLAGAAGLAPQSLLERLAEAIDTRILLTREHAPEGYRFVHSIFQEVLQAELSPQRRAHLHARVGAVLERLYGDELETHAADLAHHFSEAVPAGFVPQAVDYCLQAGRMAVSQCAWEEACSQMQRAADLLELLPARAAQRDRVFAGGVWEKLGDAYYFAADIDRAFEAYEQASRRVPLEENVWRARLKDDMANLHTLRHRFDQALACLAEADALLGSPAESADDSWWDTWLVVQQHRGMVHFTEGRLEELRRLVDQVGKTAGTHGGARERAHFQRLQMMAAWTHSRFVSTSDTMELAQECAKNYRAAGSPEDLMYAERILVQAYTWSPDQWGDAYDQLVRFLELARRNHSIWHEFPALWHMQMWHRRRGEVDAVRDYSLATLSLTAQHRGAWKEFGGEAKGHLSWVALRTGDLDQARILGVEALREIRGDSYSPFEWQARWTLLGLALHDRDWPEAVRQAEAMLDPSQHKMPDDLEESLRALIQVQAQGDKPVEALAASARAHGYL